MNAALAFWLLTHLVTPACVLFMVLIVVDAVNDWLTRKR